MNNTQLARKHVNILRSLIGRYRKAASSTPSSRHWSHLMHRLKSFKKDLVQACIDLREHLYCDKAYFDLYGKMQECLIIGTNYWGSVEVRSLVDGKYYKVAKGTNKGYSLT